MADIGLVNENDKMKILVEIEHGVWLADGDGDPCRTTHKDNALRYGSYDLAFTALALARSFRGFRKARVYCDFTFKDLRDRLNNLTDKDLSQPIYLARTDKPSVMVDSLWELEEDHINPSGDGLEPVSAYSTNPDDDDYLDLDYEPITSKGTLFLVEPDS